MTSGLLGDRSEKAK